MINNEINNLDNYPQLQKFYFLQITVLKSDKIYVPVYYLPWRDSYSNIMGLINAIVYA